MKKLIIISSCVLLLSSCASNRAVYTQFRLKSAVDRCQDAQIKHDRKVAQIRLNEIEQRIEELEEKK